MYLSLYTKSYVLFEQWTTVSLIGVLLGIVVGCVLTLLAEGLNHYIIYWRNTRELQYIKHRERRRLFIGAKKSEICSHLALSAMNSLSALLAHLAMMFLMTYNVWIMISLIVGRGLGHYIMWPWLILKCNLDQKASERFKPPSKRKTSDTAEQHELLKLTKETHMNGEENGCKSKK